jgi:hypothetical protein
MFGQDGIFMEQNDSADAKKVQKKTAEKHQEKKPAFKGGMSAPKFYQRCMLCGVRSKCKSIGTKRGSSSCCSARYMSKNEHHHK